MSSDSPDDDPGRETLDGTSFPDLTTAFHEQDSHSDMPEQGDCRMDNSQSVNQTVQESGTYAMDELPDEVLSHILNLCHLRDVCRSMSVSKRMERAARLAIRTRKTVAVYWDKRIMSKEERDVIIREKVTCSQLDIIIGDEECRKMCSSIINCLNQMACLRTLIFRVRFRVVGHMSDVVTRNASTLRTLAIPHQDFPLTPDLIYPHLRQLECRFLPTATAAARPVLQKLDFSAQETDVFHRLPHNTMRELMTYVEYDPEEEADFVAGVLHLIHLETIRISGYDFHPDVVDRISDTLTRLTDIGLEVSGEGSDNAVAMLARRHPGLRRLDLELYGEDVTDATLTSLSPLTQLVSLMLVTYDSDTAFTGNAIVSFLRGGSRRTLNEFKIRNGRNTDFPSAETEIRVMEEERGIRLRVTKTLYSISFKAD